MTRIFADGAEFNDTLFFSSAGAIVTQGSGRSGTYSYQVNAATGFKSITGISEMYFRQGIYINYSGSDNSDNGVVKFRNGGTDHVTVFWYSAGNNFGINAGGSAGVAYGSVRGKQVWLLMEVYVKIANSPNGRVIVKIDGVTDIDYTGDTQNGATTTVDNIAWHDFATGNFNFDDVALNDTNGLVDNSWCGDGHILRIYPSGSGTTNNWTNSGGVSASANYLYVDEISHDSDTTYVYTFGDVPGTQDHYNMTTFSLPQGAQIKHIYPETRARKTSSLYDYGIKLGYLPSGGTDQISGSYALTTSYAGYVGTSASANPISGSPFTQADIDAIEYVCEVA